MKVELFRFSPLRVVVDLPETCPKCDCGVGIEGIPLRARSVAATVFTDVDMPYLAETQDAARAVNGVDYNDTELYPYQLSCTCGEVLAVVPEEDPLERMGFDQQEFDALVLKKAEELIAARRLK